MDSVRQVPKCFGSAQTLARFGDNEDDVTNVVVDSVLVDVTAKRKKRDFYVKSILAMLEYQKMPFEKL